MSLTIVSASNPKYTSKDGKSIDLVVKFAEFPNPITFHAMEIDTLEHGKELFRRAAAGEFGSIEPFVEKV
jgi:hypothetical protein